MAKGSGLSIDSDPFGFFFRKPMLLNSFPEAGLEDAPSSSSPPSSIDGGFKFPVNLNSSSHDLSETPPPSDDVKGATISEMDFFSDDKIRKFRDSSVNDGGYPNPRELTVDVNTGLNLLTTNTTSNQSIVDDRISSNPDYKRSKNELAVLQAEVERMNTENQRLREMLNQGTTNYQVLQLHLMSLLQNQKAGEAFINGGRVGPRQFMDLGLSSKSGEPSSSFSEERGRSHERSASPRNYTEVGAKEEHNKKSLGRKTKREDEESNRVSNKVPRTESTNQVDQTVATMRKARVSVRTRSEAPMINDGCQWRKYGQKMAKGNPCPRAYYRCTMASSCPVRKQVQRCAEDQTILTTTYEGNHNHPLPVAAMAMASTTTSATRMLLSGAMCSSDALMIPNFITRPTPFLPCSSSMATISASAPFPTVTLDLTQKPPDNFINPPPTLIPQFFGQSLYNQSKFSGLQISQETHTSPMGRQLQQLQNGLQSSMGESLSSATAAIASDPNFTAALKVAISSIIGNTNGVSDIAASKCNDNSNN